MGKSLIPEFLRDLCALCGEKFGLALLEGVLAIPKIPSKLSEEAVDSGK
jgi:hypothetical protein